jgi:hypothetical protein
MTNPFATESAWDVRTGGTILPEGDHVCEITEIDGGGNSSGGYPQIEVRLGNADGEIRDWIVVLPTTVGKVVQLIEAVGLERPDDDQVHVDGAGFRLDPKYLDQLYGKKVGVIVRSEPDRKTPGVMRDRVAGYKPASEIAASDVTPPGAADSFKHDAGSTAQADKKIPF